MGGGSISVNTRHEFGGEKSANRMGAVQLATGIKETTSDPVTNAMTYVARGYRDFGVEMMIDQDVTTTTSVYMATVGPFMIAVQHLDAADGSATDMAAIFGDDATSSTRDTALDIANVTFTGRFDFTTNVYLDAMANCGSGDIIPVWILNAATVDDDDDMTHYPVTLRELGAEQPTDTMTDPMYLCLRVRDGSGALGPATIPGTDNYMAMSSYKGIDDAKHPAMGDPLHWAR